MKLRLGVSLALVAGVLASGCAGSYHDSWKRRNPSWFSTFPDRGTGLHETLAGLQAPSGFESRQSISKLAVLAVTAEGATELSQEEIASRLGSNQGEDLAIVATLDCRSKIDTRMWFGQKVTWLLLEEGRLSAWDLHVFGSRCVVGNDFRPADRESADLERQVRAFRDAKFPRSMGHVSEYYAKGLIYAQQRRRADAEEMLAKGDRTFDPGSDLPVRFERPSDKVVLRSDDETAALRNRLVRDLDFLQGLDTGE